MDKNKTQQQQTTPPPTPKQPWQKPRLQQLNISLDTANTLGSGGDGLGMNFT
jgi:hypothetical protein